MQKISSTSVDVSVLVDAVQTECSRRPDRLTDGIEAGGVAKIPFKVKNKSTGVTPTMSKVIHPWSRYSLTSVSIWEEGMFSYKLCVQ